jgi:diacylglycerol kinase family enzyme
VYFYILDGQNIPPAKFEKTQIELQGLLAEFRISGDMARVTSLRSIRDLVETASERGVKTLIACGTDATFNYMLAYLRGRDFALGFVPMDETPSYLSKMMGIDSLQTAVKTIAARRIEKVDLASVGDSYFLSHVEFGIAATKVKQMGLFNSVRAMSIPEHRFVIRIDDSYNMDITCLGGMVVNSRSTSSGSSLVANPTDGQLDLLILEKLNKVDIVKYKEDINEGILENVPNTSVIKCRKVEFLEPHGYPLSIDGKTFGKIPETIEIIPRRLRIIVGKNRTF